MYLSYVGIRVTDLERSLAFYSRTFGLEEVADGDNSPLGGGRYALLRDPVSGLKLELNWYPPGSPYCVPYVPGEGLDHIAFRVENVEETLRYLREKGIESVQIGPRLAEPGPGVQVAYVKDPDGNWVELYHSPRPMPHPVPYGY